MKLSYKIILAFLTIIIISFLIVSLVSEKMIDNKFNIYLVDEKEEKIEKIQEEINSIYQNNGYILYQKEINSYANLENINISVLDTNGNQIPIKSNSNKGHNHGQFRSLNSMNHIKNKDHTEKTYPLLKDNVEVGTIIISYLNNSYISQNALVFKDTLGSSFMISGIFTILIGLLISIVLSHSLTKPLVAINSRAREIRNGNLSPKNLVDTTTLEIKELAQTIEGLTKSLASQEDVRKRYASDISHELRTPITTIKGYLEGIIDGIWDADDESLKVLLTEIDRLSLLVENLNRSFQAESFKTVLNKEKFDLSKEITNLINGFQPVFKKENKHIYGNIEEDISIYMDKNKLNQIIHNLISNSLKHLDPDGYVEIKLKKLGLNEVLIQVVDNGIGIKEKDIPYIFNRFYRPDESRSKETGGYGIGLAIVKSFVEEHGGKINLVSEFSKGTSVNITLPLVKDIVH